MLVVTEIKAVEVKVVCPHCNEDVDGWCCDPRGEVSTCDECGGKFKIHEEADIEMY